MNDNFFDDESAHSMLMYWWHGVIVDDMYWAGCTNDDRSNEYSKIHNADKLEARPRKGWGKRYKVAVVGSCLSSYSRIWSWWNKTNFRAETRSTCNWFLC
jgi:hypothetical protein